MTRAMSATRRFPSSFVQGIFVSARLRRWYPLQFRQIATAEIIRRPERPRSGQPNQRWTVFHGLRLCGGGYDGVGAQIDDLLAVKQGRACACCERWSAGKRSRARPLGRWRWQWLDDGPGRSFSLQAVDGPGPNRRHRAPGWARRDGRSSPFSRFLEAGLADRSRCDRAAVESAAARRAEACAPSDLLADAIRPEMRSVLSSARMWSSTAGLTPGTERGDPTPAHQARSAPHERHPASGDGGRAAGCAAALPCATRNQPVEKAAPGLGRTAGSLAAG